MARPVAAVLALVLAAAVAGCADDTESGGTVTLLTHDSFSLPQSVWDTFRRETGLTVTVVKSGDAGQLASTVSLTPGSPKADAVYGIDNTFARRPVDAGALATYDPPTAARGAAAFAVPGAEGKLTAIDRGDVCLNVDETWYRDHRQQAPTSLGDLRKPAVAAQTVVLDPATSSPGMAFLLATIGRDRNGWQDFWRTLIRDGATISSGWETAYNQTFSAGEGKGPKPVVVSYASSPAATPGTKALLDSCFSQVEYYGILRGARNEPGARKLADFLLSPTVQKELPESMYVYPVTEGVALPASWREAAPAPPATVTVSAADIAKNRETWLQQWRAAVGR